MKTKVLLAAVFLIGSAVSAQAATIVGSKHDLSKTNAGANSFKSTTQDQTCVFCHTPHSAAKNKLLWNRADGGNANTAFSIYTSYNNSAFRGAAALSGKYKVIPDNSSSLLCLSCHGLTSISAIMTNTNNAIVSGDAGPFGAGRNSNGVAWAAAGGAGLGTNLSNTHPIAINYSEAQGLDSTGLKAKLSVDSKVRFFSATGVADSLECASCHTVHDPTNVPFLAINNAGSALCTACHNK